MAESQVSTGPSNAAPASSNSRGSNRRRYRPRNLNQANNSDSNADTPQSGTEEHPSRGSSHRGRAHHRGRPHARGGPSKAPSREPQLPSQPSHPGHSRGRGRSGRARYGATSMVPGRQFAGQLTKDTDEDSQSVASSSVTPAATDLNVDAAVFRPGSRFVPHPRQPKGKSNKGKNRRTSVSSAPDLSTRIHEDIDNQCYECAVCTDEINRRAKVWFCRTCWAVFHLKCMQKWARSKADTTAQNTANTANTANWRCPGCNLEQENLPGQFTCWCRKEIDPPSLPGLPPFSCGQTCSRQRLCPHSCSSICHAGPCPPCAQMGPSQSCFCGREEKTRRCVDTDYKNGWSCGQVCNELMPCGEHYCGRPCHEGLCGACEVPIDARCYCGQETMEIPCCDRGEDKESAKAQTQDDGDGLVDRWIGIFKCDNLCQREFDCGKHQCEKSCHPQDENIAHCPRSPDVVTHCPCGKTLLEELSLQPRSSCEDDIALCPKPCLKKLICGHECQQVCHTGDCTPCLQEVEVPCRCGRATFKKMCFERDNDQPLCTRICHANLNCGRHECGERCCSGERKASERVATRKKLRSLHSLDSAALEPDVEAEHICTRVCGRILKCGNHTCQDLCHRGPCSTCREAIFEEISCHCGLTILYPPLPCGTQPPSCRYECQRTTECGHPAVSHNCHLDNESCPKCPYHTTKACLCGKNQLKNQPCWLTEVRCGEVCGKKLKCGYHTCRKTCHRPGECEDAGVACPQPCGKSKSCGHPCSDPCHSPFSCKEDKPCQYKLFITCTCQRIKQEAKCNATKATPGNTIKSLPCDDECLRLERNRKLQLALKIDPVTHSDDHIPYSDETISTYLSIDPAWAQGQEKVFRAFAGDPDQKRLRFKPMKNHQRAFLHLMAEDYGFDSESMDPEPHRHVALFKTPRFVSAPLKSLVDCVRIKQRLRAEAGKTVATAAPAPIPDRNSMNAFLITNARFGLTSDEVKATLATALPTQQFDVLFRPASSSTTADEVVLLPLALDVDPVSEPRLWAMKPVVTKALAAQQMGHLLLCRVDENSNVMSRESEVEGGGTGGGGIAAGWSRVAAKAAAAPRRVPVVNPVMSKSSFVVLGSGVGNKKKKKQEESVVEDWEMEEERLEKEEEMKEV